MSRIFIIHGWGGGPNRDWMAWAKKELEQKGYQVIVPEMPDTQNPKITPWLKKMGEVVGSLRKDDILIGHSIGTLAILRYLDSLSSALPVSKIILIAPWQTLTLGEDEDPSIAVPWVEEPLNWEKVRTMAQKIITVFSEDDPWVPIDKNLEFFKEKLHPEVVIKKGMGHFNQSDAPFLLELIK